MIVDRETAFHRIGHNDVSRTVRGLKIRGERESRVIGSSQHVENLRSQTHAALHPITRDKPLDDLKQLVNRVKSGIEHKLRPAVKQGTARTSHVEKPLEPKLLSLVYNGVLCGARSGRTGTSTCTGHRSSRSVS